MGLPWPAGRLPREDCDSSGGILGGGCLRYAEVVRGAALVGNATGAAPLRSNKDVPEVLQQCTPRAILIM